MIVRLLATYPVVQPVACQVGEAPEPSIVIVCPVMMPVELVLMEDLTVMLEVAKVRVAPMAALRFRTTVA